MQMIDDTLTPGQQGSDHACAVLRVLHRHRNSGGLSALDLSILAGLPQQATRAALAGLQDRGRVHCTGHGLAARWQLVPPRTATPTATAEGA